MSSTHLALHYHLVFSTKNREPRIAKSWRHRLHGYLGGISKESEFFTEAVGGVADHVHMLIGAPATARLSDIARDIKTNSSKWVHAEIGDHAFAWQEGYGAFSVSPSHLDGVRSYIAHQEEHHREKSFQEEYVEFLKLSGVKYDNRYLW